MSPTAFVNGAFVPLAEAKVSVFDRGFLFADGIYEVCAVLDGRLVDNPSHLARLERSLGEIEMPLPMPADEIARVQKELVARNELREGLVYMQVTRGATAERDFLFPTATPQTVVMFTQQKSYIEAPGAKTGIALKSVADIRWDRRDIKSVGLLAQVLAKEIARKAGCQEALLVEDGMVTEAGSSTPFIVTHDGTVVTRQNSHALLPGCTRLAIMQLAAEHQIKIVERPFTVAEAQGAAEVFITSATSFVMPVVRIDAATIGAGAPGPMTLRLRDIYIDMARRSPA